MLDIHILDPADTYNAISRMSASDIDKLAFGAVQLDASGKILVYNAAEGDITGRNPKEMIGKNFFKDVAPCTRSPKFEGVFLAGVKSGNLATVFDYMFDYNMTPTKVRVHMKRRSPGIRTGSSSSGSPASANSG
ncbi:MAG: photoactive yellow protein [Bryobacteraceae bacterium]